MGLYLEYGRTASDSSSADFYGATLAGRPTHYSCSCSGVQRKGAAILGVRCVSSGLNFRTRRKTWTLSLATVHSPTRTPRGEGVVMFPEGSEPGCGSRIRVRSTDDVRVPLGGTPRRQEREAILSSLLFRVTRPPFGLLSALFHGRDEDSHP